MRYAGSFALALWLGSMAFTTRSSGQELRPAAPTLAHPGNACPITIVDAEQTSVGFLLPLTNGQSNGPAQHLHITAWNFESAPIVAARIRVDGVTADIRALHMQEDSKVHVLLLQPYPSKTFDLALKLGTQETASISLLLRGFKNINFVRLDSVTYADGSSWQSSVSETCRVPVRPPGLLAQ